MLIYAALKVWLSKALTEESIHTENEGDLLAPCRAVPRRASGRRTCRAVPCRPVAGLWAAGGRAGSTGQYVSDSSTRLGGCRFEVASFVLLPPSHQSADWVAKVEGDAVIIPNCLWIGLSRQLVPDHGLYLENCKSIKYGYFGVCLNMLGSCGQVSWCPATVSTWRVASSLSTATSAGASTCLDLVVRSAGARQRYLP